MKHKVLVVDDDPNLLESYRFLLKVSGFEPFLAKDSEQALEIVKENQIAVALVDLKLKNEDGLSLIELLKKESPRVEVILITAYPSYETAVEAIKLGAFDYLSKTQEPEEIIECIQSALENSENREEEEKTPVCIIVNNSFVKKGIEIFFEKSEFVLTCSYGSLMEFIENYTEGTVEIVLICGNCFFDKTTKNFPNLKKMVTSFPEEKLVFFNHMFTDNQLKELVKIGIKGFINFNTNEERFLEIMQQVKNGKIVAPENALVNALHELSRVYAHSTSKSSDSSLLTEREREILKYMAKGMRNKELAETLCISEKTVKTHINRIFKKLNVKSRLQAIIKATEENLIY